MLVKFCFWRCLWYRDLDLNLCMMSLNSITVLPDFFGVVWIFWELTSDLLCLTDVKWHMLSITHLHNSITKETKIMIDTGSSLVVVYPSTSALNNWVLIFYGHMFWIVFAISFASRVIQLQKMRYMIPLGTTAEKTNPYKF